MGVKKSNTCHTFKEFNDEINEFYNYLKENNYNNEEIYKILSPIRSNNREYFTVFCFICIILFLYLLSFFDFFSWHFSAIGRIFLIKLLPYWDWTTWKNQKCLIEKFTITQTTTSVDFDNNCNLCENLKTIDYVPDIEQDYLMKRYINTENPVITTITEWPAIENFIENLQTNLILKDSIPCHLATNTQTNVVNVGKLLTDANELFNEFFIHFQNCHLMAMKEFRQFTPRPLFLPMELAPIQYNWLIWNRNYTVANYKKLQLTEKVTIVVQLDGANVYRLMPVNCEDLCAIIEFDLKPYEALIFTSLWDFEYKPIGMEHSLAVVLETH